MKKNIVLLLCLSLSIASLAGCGNKKEEIVTETTESIETVEEVETNVSSTEDTGEVNNTQEENLVSMSELVRPDISNLNYEDYVTVGDYTNIDISIEKQNVADEDIDAYLNNLLSSYGESVDVTDRTTLKGDYLNISFTGLIDGEEFEGGSAEDYTFILGNGEFLEDFEAPLYDINVGDIVVAEVVFPEEYTANLAGKTAEFTIVLNSVQEKIVPELTDELISEISQTAKTEEDLRNEIKETLEISYNASYTDELYTKIVEDLNAASELKEAPEDLFNYYKESLKAYYSEYAMVYGISLEEFLSVYCELTPEEFEKECIEYAELASKQALVLYAIAAKENITLSDEEYEKELEAISIEYGYESVDLLKEEISSYNGEYEMRENLLFDKVCAKIVELNS